MVRLISIIYKNDVILRVVTYKCIHPTLVSGLIKTLNNR